MTFFGRSENLGAMKAFDSKAGRIICRVECDSEIFEESASSENGCDCHSLCKANLDADALEPNPQTYVMKVNVDLFTWHNAAGCAVDTVVQLDPEVGAHIRAEQTVRCARINKGFNSRGFASVPVAQLDWQERHPRGFLVRKRRVTASQRKNFVGVAKRSQLKDAWRPVFRHPNDERIFLAGLFGFLDYRFKCIGLGNKSRLIRRQRHPAVHGRTRQRRKSCFRCGI